MIKFSQKTKQFIDFIKFNHEFRQIIRVARNPISLKFENDAEHSYQLAMLAWFLIEQDELKLNKELCLMYALAHDLVEIYAGDTYTYDKKDNLSKNKREMNAIKKIEKRFSGFKNLVKIIKKYEKKEDEESKFIYALDKIIPPIQIYMENGRLWREKKLSYNDLVENKNKKIAKSKYVDKYWKEILIGITKEKDSLFKNGKK